LSKLWINMMIGLMLLPRAPAQIAPAYQVKAAFIYNFTQFVEWPSNAYDGSQSPFVIGILGENPFGNYLEELVKDEMAGTRRIVIKKYRDADDVKSCNILYINMANCGEVLRGLRNKSILTVSDADNFTRDGGMVRFFTQNNKIRFQINPTAARAVNINISSKLLRVADIVE
jgi:hypothetical protein